MGSQPTARVTPAGHCRWTELRPPAARPRRPNVVMKTLVSLAAIDDLGVAGDKRATKAGLRRKRRRIDLDDPPQIGQQRQAFLDYERRPDR